MYLLWKTGFGFLTPTTLSSSSLPHADQRLVTLSDMSHVTKTKRPQPPASIVSWMDACSQITAGKRPKIAKQRGTLRSCLFLDRSLLST